MSKSRDLNIEKTIFDVVGNTRAPRLESETGWYKIGVSEAYAIPFENSWDNICVLAGITNAPVGFYLSENGEGRCRGTVGGGAIGTTIFTLPEEITPEYVQEFICSVDAAGNIDLSNIRFRAHQLGDE